MSFDWENYLNLAKTLTQPGQVVSANEACLRSAISRAYYAAYCQARNLAKQKEGLVLTKTGKDHGIVKNHFKKSPNRHCNKISVKLGRLLNNRKRADYDDTVSELNKLVQDSISEADTIFNLLSSIYS